MRQAIAIVVFLSVGTVGGAIGAFAAVGLVTTLWRPEVMVSLVGPGSDRSHPAHWVSPCLAV